MSEYVNEDTGEVDVVSAIIDLESGDLDVTGQLNLFSHLIKTGMVWDLQGSYGRTAASLIGTGLISAEGVVDWDLVDQAMDDE